MAEWTALERAVTEALMVALHDAGVTMVTEVDASHSGEGAWEVRVRGYADPAFMERVTPAIGVHLPRWEKERSS